VWVGQSLLKKTLARLFLTCLAQFAYDSEVIEQKTLGNKSCQIVTKGGTALGRSTRSSKTSGKFQIRISGFIVITRRMLRYAPRFHRKNLKNISPKKISQKNFTKFFVNNFFFKHFFGYSGSTANLGYACKNLGGLGPLVWEEIEFAQTVHKGLAKLLYRFLVFQNKAY
jgi:hypothetical protein